MSTERTEAKVARILAKSDITFTRIAGQSDKKPSEQSHFDVYELTLDKEEEEPIKILISGSQPFIALQASLLRAIQQLIGAEIARSRLRNVCRLSLRRTCRTARRDRQRTNPLEAGRDSPLRTDKTDPQAGRKNAAEALSNHPEHPPKQVYLGQHSDSSRGRKRLQLRRSLRRRQDGRQNRRFQARQRRSNESLCINKKRSYRNCGARGIFKQVEDIEFGFRRRGEVRESAGEAVSGLVSNI